MKVNAVPLLVLGLLGSGLAAPQGPANISPTVATNNGGASLGPANAIHNAPNGGGPLVPGGKPVTLPAPHNGGKPVTLPTPHNGGSSPLQPAGSPTQAKVKEASKLPLPSLRCFKLWKNLTHFNRGGACPGCQSPRGAG